MPPIVPLPSASDFLTQVGSTSAPMFQSLLPLGYMEAGLFVGAIVVVFIVVSIGSSLSSMIESMTRKGGKYDTTV